jgi:hypothetical protein
MKSRWLIEQRLETETEPFAREALRWVLDSPECPMCNLANRREVETSVFSGEHTGAYYEQKWGWNTGTVDEHMEHHIDYDPNEAREVEGLRKEAISTLDMAEDVFARITKWLDEWEEVKDAEGINREWLAEATKLVSAGNNSLKLIGTLKKEIGVDSQLLLAGQQTQQIMGIIVDVLQNQPKLLNDMELRLAALRPPDHVVDVEWTEG